MRLFQLVAGWATVLTMGLAAHSAPGPWDQPAAALAGQIAGILGPGQAGLTVRNLSEIPAVEIGGIRSLLEQDLKAHGIVISDGESANMVRVTLSQNERERLWVAEVVEGNETKVVMVHVNAGTHESPATINGVTLRRHPVFVAEQPVLAALIAADSLVAVEPEEIVIYGRSAQGWREQKRFGIGQKHALARDPRAVILPGANGRGFDAWIDGVICGGSIAEPYAEMSIHSAESDDPWPIAQPAAAQETAAAEAGGRTPQIKAFYNSARNYFTGLVTPGLGVDLPPFYSATVLPRLNGAGLLITGIDGKVQLVENGRVRPVSGARDWGSDVALLRSGCGAGAQIIASGSGMAENDSLRAYEVPGDEAVPASPPLAMDGMVTALWSAPDSASVIAVVQQKTGKFEVDVVSAMCN